jgi:L-ascorbate metabolism protein UlaG (beta-lactamase superfamily)
MGKWIGGVAAMMTMAALLIAAPVQAQGKSIDFTKEPACDSLTPTSMGGAAPKSPRLLVVRYLGSSNHEIAYRSTVLLLNAHYARTPPARALGFTRDDVKKVDALLIGHGHGDHMSDAPYVAMKTGAPLVGAPITTTQAQKMGLADTQLITVTGRGGEVKKFKDITVEPMLGRHGDGDADVGAAQNAAYRQLMTAAKLTRTSEQQAKARAEQAGSNDPHILDEGVISYLMTLDGNTFRIIFRDTSGSEETPGTPAERAMMQRIGSTDLAIVSYSTLVPQSQATTIPLTKLYNPHYYMPTHHDEVAAGRFDTPMEPLFLRMRDELPQVHPISPLYREPICFDTQTKAVFIGESARDPRPGATK